MSTVEIVPPVIHAVPGAKFQVEAIARDAAGTPIATPGAFQWSGGITFSSASSNPTTVTAPATGQHAFSVSVGSKSAPNATLIVAAASAGSDQVTLEPANGGPVSAVLLDANVSTSASNCQNDLVYRIAGAAALGRNLTPGCANALAVFAPGHAVRFECHRQSGRPNCGTNLATLWTNGVDAVVRDPLPPPLTIDLVVWLRASEPPAEVSVIAQADANYASSIYGAQRAAMTFSIVPGGGANGSVKSLSVPDNAVDPCQGVEQTLDFDAVEGSVNVVYVEDILFNSSPRAVACNRAAGLPPIIVMRYGGKSTTTLAHELGHVMGLMRSAFNDFMGGHTNNIAGFDRTNLMWSGESGIIGLARDRISLGQAFRMHVDTRSWVNMLRDAPVAGTAKLPRIRTGDTETCQLDRTTSTPCPMLRQSMGTP